jgi:hypothetical protein
LRASVNYHFPLLLWLKKLLLSDIFKMLKITLPPSQPSPRGEGVKKLFLLGGNGKGGKRYQKMIHI